MATTNITMRIDENLFAISMDVPNAETQEAIEEVRRMKQNPSIGKTYTDVDEMMRELLA